MFTHPEAEQELGCKLSELTYRKLDEAIERGLHERTFLEFKRRPSGTSGTRPSATNFNHDELAKDVAALANAGGGILIFGVVEENECATGIEPIDQIDKWIESFYARISLLIRPHLNAEIFACKESSDGDSGVIVIAISNSCRGSRPFAKTSSTGEIKEFPARFGRADTRFLTEDEVAMHYRERFRTQSESWQSLESIQSVGLQRL
ncbi:MAG: ATP-binding protein, partial [Acidimicrobiaceae bacterium]|nr:ATP-binding protein [Acidimicrobiaceae bacterium]